MNKRSFFQIILCSFLILFLPECGNNKNKDQNGNSNEDVEWFDTEEYNKDKNEVVMDVIFEIKESDHKKKYIDWHYTLKTASGKFIPFDNEGDYKNYIRLSEIADQISKYQGDTPDIIQYVFDQGEPEDYDQGEYSKDDNFRVYLSKHKELLPKIRDYYIKLIKNIEIYLDGNKNEIDQKTFRKIDKLYYDKRIVFNEPSLSDFSYGKKSYNVLGGYRLIFSNDYFDKDKFLDENMNKISDEYVIIY